MLQQTWEQRKLADILSRRKENRCIDSAYPRLAFAAGQGVIPLSERRTNNRDQLISDEKNKKYLVTYYNDIVYNPANLKYGAIDRNKYGQGVISPIYVTFTSNICSGFVEHIVKSHEFKEKVLSFEEGTVTKRQAVNPDNLLKIDVVITSNSKEQEKISKLFELIDRFITLHQRKLEHLKLKKKSLLQKLFPKEGEVYPELRFPGFTDPWEQRKFGELFLERREKTTEENEDILLSCAITGIYLNSDLFSHFRGSSTVGYLKVRKNDLILSAQNLHLGNANINFNFEHGMISPAYKVFEIESCDPYFVNAWVKKDSTKIFFLKVTTEGASQCRKNIDWDALINQDLLTPNAFEQEAIGKFFYQLDRYITLHQRKLEHLQLLKKALLQQLFV